MPRTAIILGGGGLTGEAFEAGVLSALHEVTGNDPRDADLIVGTSAGSQVAASLRFGLAARDLKAYIAKEELTPEGQRIFDRIGPIPELPQPFPRPKLRPPSPRTLASALRAPWRARHAWLTTIIPTGSFDLTPYEDVFRNITGADWCDAGLWIVGARLPLCERVVFGRDAGLGCDVPRAVSASCCVPGIFMPVKIGDHLYVDGGIHSPTNADLVLGEGYDEVIVVSPMSTDRRALQRGRVNPIRVWCRARLASEVKKLRRDGAKVTVFQPGLRSQRVMGINALDDARCPEVANIAYHEAIRRLDATHRRWEPDELAA
jgi:NTE family protein